MGVDLVSSGRRGVRALLLATVTLVLLATASWAAVTDNLIPTTVYRPSCSVGQPDANGPVCQTDNTSLSYYTDCCYPHELEAKDKQVVVETMQNQYNPTDLNAAYDSTPIFSGSSETDVVYEESGVPTGFDGVTWCNDPVDTAIYNCDQQYVRIRGFEGGLDHYTHGLTCHETGHAVGLLHGDDASPILSVQDTRLGCMVKIVGQETGLGTNNRDNINSVY